jgi:hypothetical protein
VRPTFFYMVAALCFWPLVLPGVPTAETAYVRQEEIAVRLDEREYTTSLPLDPSREYRVTLQSAYTLRPVLDFAHKCFTHNEATILTRRVYPVTECRTDMPFLVNDDLIPTRDNPNAQLAAYFLKTYSHAHYVPLIVLHLWGTGKPLSLKSTADFSDRIPTATAAVVDIVHEKAMEKEAEARAEQQKRRDMIHTAIKIGGGVLVVVVVIGVWCGVAARPSETSGAWRG